MAKQVAVSNGRSGRKAQILQAAIEIIVRDGYASLGMRSLARASGLKLGALQYHFANWEALLKALVHYIEAEYWEAWESWSGGEQISLHESLRFVLEDPPAGNLHSDRLWPQLWAMGLVEPIVQKLVDNIYARFLTIFERTLERAGSSSPHVEAIALMCMLEGATLFVSPGRHWEKNAEAVSKLVFELVAARYPEENG